MFVSVHKHAKTELGQIPAILTSRLVNNPQIILTIYRQGVAGFDIRVSKMAEKKNNFMKKVKVVLVINWVYPYLSGVQLTIKV